ncbi:MAG: GGDEF domain-containing protein [Rubrivivax sp.]|nr:GGDEF domain-containing protein [Rubrivivax sp.]
MTRQNPRPTLLKLLTLPFLAVVVAKAAVIGWLSFQSGSAAVEHAAQQWLRTTVQRIGDELEQHSTRADALLQAALAAAQVRSVEPLAEPEELARQLLAALPAHAPATQDLSLVSSAGQALTVRRLSASDAEWIWQADPAGPVLRQLLGSRSADPARPALDPREQAWVRLAWASAQASWTPLQIDTQQNQLTLMRIRPAGAGAGQAPLVAGTTVPLKPLQEALHALQLPARGVAFIVERDGRLVASSAGPVLRRAADGSWQRVAVHEAGSPLMSAAYDQVLPQLGGRSLAQPGLVLLNGGPVPLMATFARVTEGAQHDWALIVAAPLGDFSSALMANIAHTAAAALVAAAVILLLGAWVRQRLGRDAAHLVDALQRIGDGDLDTPPEPMRSAETQVVRETLHRVQLRLRTDRVTGLANREAILKRLHDRMRPGRRHNDAPLLALLFVDLDRFRSVNENHGHEAGDFVLQTVGRRLRQTVRDTDLVARWAGDEFVVLLDGVGTADHAQRARDQVERVLRDPVELGPGRDAVELDGTVGLALSPADGQEPDSLLRAAEEDMLRRKPSSLSQW